MIIAIGCDITEHYIAEKLRWSSNLNIKKRIFSTNELEQSKLSNEIQFLCGRFAAKEAVVKCLRIGFEDGMSSTEIEIIKSTTGVPEILLHGNVARRAKELNIQIWHLSISHSTNYSMAVVIASKL